MSALSVTPAMITTALDQSNFVSSNGFLNDYNRMYLTVTDANVKNLDELKKLVISNDGKRVLRLQDIANVKIAEQTEYVRVNANGKSAVLVAVVKQPNANLITITHEVEKKIAELNKSILPRGGYAFAVLCAGRFCKRQHTQRERQPLDRINFGHHCVHYFFFVRVKSSAVILITIPLTISLTVLSLYVLGYTFNIMTLGAIAASIGLIIDDAIVVVEQIHRTHRGTS